MKDKNFEFWLQGAYFYHALLCASPAFKDFIKKENAKPIEYMREPFNLSSVNEEKEDISEMEKENIRLRTYIYLKNWASSVKINNKESEWFNWQMII